MATDYACASNSLACRARVDDATKPLHVAIDRLRELYDEEHTRTCRLRTELAKVEKERDEALGCAVKHVREINRLLTTNPKLREWIECPEGLPPFGETVLMYTKDEKVVAGWLERIDKGGKLWFQFEVVGISPVHGDPRAFRSVFEVTHWRPMPDRPDNLTSSEGEQQTANG